MNILCPSCGVKGNLPESQIPEDKISIKIVCPKCKAEFDVAVNSPSISGSSDVPAEIPIESPPVDVPSPVSSNDSFNDPSSDSSGFPFPSDDDSDLIADDLGASVNEDMGASDTSNDSPFDDSPFPESPSESLGGSDEVAQSFGGDDGGEVNPFEDSSGGELPGGEESGPKGYLLRDHNFKFYGLGKELFIISAVNLILTILTFGIYKFWAKVKVRQYFYSQTEFLREKLAFHGTGVEMFKGFGRFLLIAVPLVGLRLLFEYDSTNPGAQAMGSIVEFVIFWILLPLILVGSLRYKLSRTSWHGIRFSFRGPVKEAIIIYLKAGVLLPLTFGFYYIYFRTNWQRYLRNNVYYGNKHSSYSGAGGDLVKAYYKKLIFFYFCLFLIIMVFVFLISVVEPIGGQIAAGVVGGLMALSIIMLGVYFAASLKSLFFGYDWDNTYFEDIKFSSTADTKEIFNLYISNFFIFVFTLGFGTPWITVRNYLFRSYHIKLNGALDVEGIKQDFLSSDASGDVGADFFDIDAGAF